MMGFIALLLLAFAGDVPAQPHWTLTLDQKFGYQRFDRGFSRNWYGQEGVAFLSPERIAVFQAIQTDHISLSRRNSTGGGGNFFVQVEVLDASDGHEIKNLQLPTNGLVSRLLPTHDGMFLLRTGDMMYLYSQDYQPIASLRLPVDPGEPQYWDVKISPSGKYVFAVRQYASGGVWGDNTDKFAKVELLNADNLKEITTFAVPRLTGWSPGEGVVLCWDPFLNRGYGLLSAEGQWTEIERSLYRDLSGKISGIQLLGHNRLGIFGLSQLSVFANAKYEIFSHFVGGHVFSSIRNADDFLAAINYNGAPQFENGKLTGVTSSHIELYDLRDNQKLVDFPIPEIIATFDVSPKGDLVVAHGNKLEFFQNRSLPENQALQ